jgi:hypothetical protein
MECFPFFLALVYTIQVILYFTLLVIAKFSGNIKDSVQEYNTIIFHAMLVKSCNITIIIIKSNILHEKWNFITTTTYNFFHALKHCFQSYH